MVELMVCPKCKKKEIKVITPSGKKGYWLICEKCDYERLLPDNEKTRRMFEVEMMYVNFLTACYVYTDDLKKIIKSMCNFKLERFAKIIKEE